jgi:hypothetical protein
MSTATATEPQPRALLTVPAAARRLSLHPQRLRRAIAAGDVRAVTLAGAVRVPLAEIERLLAAAK